MCRCDVWWYSNEYLESFDFMHDTILMKHLDRVERHGRDAVGDRWGTAERFRRHGRGEGTERARRSRRHAPHNKIMQCRLPPGTAVKSMLILLALNNTQFWRVKCLFDVLQLISTRIKVYIIGLWSVFFMTANWLIFLKAHCDHSNIQWHKCELYNN